MESRKMVVMNLLEGKEQRHRRRMYTVGGGESGHSGGRREWDERRK